jgi:cytochrome P450
MSKVDSFLRESQRVNGQGTCAQSIALFRTTNADLYFNSVTMSRLALKDFTFSNGTVIPAGTTVAVPMYAIHHDKNIWPDPFTFDPYRSSRVQYQDAGDVKQQMVTSSSEFLPWGYGRHAWYVTFDCSVLPQLAPILVHACSPGRFFAVNELKTMLAYVVHSYDIKFEQERVRPTNVWFGEVCLPHQSAEVMFRKRTKTPAI